MYWMKSRYRRVCQSWPDLHTWIKRNNLTASCLAVTDLLWLIEHGIEVSKATASRKFAKDLAEELLRIHVASLAAPVLLPATGLTCVKACCAVHVVLFPFAFVTEDLKGKKRIKLICRHICRQFDERMRGREQKPRRLRPAEQTFP